MIVIQLKTMSGINPRSASLVIWLESMRGTNFVVGSPAFQLERQRIEICLDRDRRRVIDGIALKLAVEEIIHDNSLPILDESMALEAAASWRAEQDTARIGCIETGKSSSSVGMMGGYEEAVTLRINNMVGISSRAWEVSLYKELHIFGKCSTIYRR